MTSQRSLPRIFDSRLKNPRSAPATSRSRTPKNNSGVPGRPSYSLTQQQLRALIDVGFNVGQIAEMRQVSKSTIERRLVEFGISTRSY